MKKIVIIYLLLLPTVFIAQISKAVGDFNTLKISDRLLVELFPSEENKVIIDGNDTDKVKVINKNGVLKLKMDLSRFLSGNRTTVKLYFKKLDKIIVKEGSTLSTDGTLESTTLSLKVKEGSVVTATIKTERLDMKVCSGAIVTFKGNTAQQNISIQSGGIYNAQELNSDISKITVFAGGKGSINVLKSLDVNVNAGGVIDVYGNPKEKKQNIFLGGIINEFKE